MEESDHSCSSVINQLIERGVAVLDNRKWAEPLTLSINLGAGDCLDVTVPTAENPWDFYVHLVSRLCPPDPMLFWLIKTNTKTP